jgi:hypothetical protein
MERMGTDRRVGGSTFVLLAATVALGLVGSLAADTVDVQWRWWRTTVWAAVAVLFLIAVVGEYARRRREIRAATAHSDAIRRARSGARWWRRRRAEAVVWELADGDGPAGLIEFHDLVVGLAGHRRRRRADDLIRALSAVAVSAGRYDLATDQQTRLTLYDITRSTNRSGLPAAASKALLQVVQRYPAKVVLAGHPTAVRNLVQALAIELHIARLRYGDVSSPTEWDDAEDCGRLTGVIEAYAREASLSSPAVARLVRTELLDVTRDIRREVISRVHEYLPGDSSRPNLDYEANMARGYHEQVDQPRGTATGE